MYLVQGGPVPPGSPYLGICHDLDRGAWIPSPGATVLTRLPLVAEFSILLARSVRCLKIDLLAV